MYEVNDILMCKAGKYKGRKVEITDRHIGHTPVLYSCKVMANNAEIALYENELETVYQHDMEMLKLRSV